MGARVKIDGRGAMEEVEVGRGKEWGRGEGGRRGLGKENK